MIKENTFEYSVSCDCSILLYVLDHKETELFKVFSFIIGVVILLTFFPAMYLRILLTSAVSAGLATK